MGENETLYRKLTLDSIACVQDKQAYRVALDSANRDRVRLDAERLAEKKKADAVEDKYVSLQAKSAKYVPKTKAGVVLHKVGNAFKVIGIGAVAILTLKLIL